MSANNRKGPPRLRGEAVQRDRETESQRDRGSEDQRIRGSDETYDTQDSALSASVQTLQEAARITIERGLENCHFNLARAIKAFEAFHRTRLPERELQSAFAVWWSAAQSQGRLPLDAEFEEYLFLFLDSCQRVKHPLGSNVLEVATQRAAEQPPPEQAAQFTSPKLKKLITVCYHLQRMAGNEPFFLSVRSAAALLDVEISSASAFLNGLVQKRVIELVQKGAQGGRKASRYRMPTAL